MSLGLFGSSQTTGASLLLQAAPFVNCRKSSVVSVSQTLWVVSLLQGQEEQGLCCARACILHVLLAAGPGPAAGDLSGPSGPGFCSMNLMAAAEHPWVSRRKARAGEATLWQFPGSEGPERVPEASVLTHCPCLPTQGCAEGTLTWPGRGCMGQRCQDRTDTLKAVPLAVHSCRLALGPGARFVFCP